MKTFLATALALCVGGCASATVSEPSACDSQSISFPTPSVPAIPSQYDSPSTCDAFSITIPSVSTTTSVDLSDTLSKLSDVTNKLSVTVTELTLDNSQGLLNWVPNVSVWVSSSTLPMKQLATYTMPKSGMPSQLNFDVVMSGSDVFNYFSSGNVTLTISLGSATVTACDAENLLANSSSLTTNLDLCVAATGSFSKSL
jgi:hypothetical protein